MKHMIFIYCLGIIFSLNCCKQNNTNNTRDKNLEPSSTNITTKKTDQYYYSFELIDTTLDSINIAQQLEQKVLQLTEVTDISEYIVEYTPTKGDSLYWNALIEKKKIIPFLIHHISDTTPTKLVNYTSLGQLCIRALNELIYGLDNMIMSYVKSNYSNYDHSAGWSNYQKYMNKAEQNRKALELFLVEWYNKQQNLLQFKAQIPYLNGRTKNKEKIIHPIGGFYEIKKN